MKLVGISGSLRKDSYNTALLRAAADLMPEGTSLAVETIHGIPLYDADAEAADGIPARVEELKESIIGAEGVILATPEYNNSMPGVLKNAVDWLSRPPADSPKVFANRPFAVIGASPGGFGTVLAQSAWLPVLRTLGVRPWFGAKMMLSQAGKAFDDSGQLADENARKRLQKYLAGFVEFIGDA
jgi:NAD(P)H-dependent FMN reductase